MSNQVIPEQFPSFIEDDCVSMQKASSNDDDIVFMTITIHKQGFIVQAVWSNRKFRIETGYSWEYTGSNNILLNRQLDTVHLMCAQRSVSCKIWRSSKSLSYDSDKNNGLQMICEIMLVQLVYWMGIIWLFYENNTQRRIIQ